MLAGRLPSAPASARSHHAAPKPSFAQRISYCAPARPAHRIAVCYASQGKVNVLVVGSGGREHALAWKLSQSALCRQLYVAPGNPGTGAEPGIQNAAINVADNAAVVKFCKDNGIDLVMVGPEVPLVAGLTDALAAAGVRAFGPSAKAAQLEGSKAFMKHILRKYSIPTAEYETFTDPEAAKAYVRRLGAPIVVKTSGLAAGKGVTVAQTVDEALAAVDDAMVKNVFGDAGAEVVIEEFLDGEEASFFALVDGLDCVALASAQDHKAVGDGDTGPNTGGMGAYSPAPVVTPQIEAEVMETIVRATAKAMVAEGCPYRGVLFAGLMIKNGKAKLLEHNVRFGDPECQGLMARLDSDLLDALLKACDGRLGEVKLSWRPEASLTVVMAAKGYPGSYKKGTAIKGIEKVTSAKVFHAGTAPGADGVVVASGGRVLNVTALGKDVAEAQAKAYEGVKAIDWEDGFFRKDIGWRAVARLKQQKH